jgi:WD40 repeat protein
MATVGDNQQLLIWDISNMKILAQKYLSFIPSAVKYSPDGDILIIGSVNGRLMLLDSQMQKNPHSAEDEQPFIISLEQLPFDNDQNISNTVLNIEFSSKGEMMVVSYGTLINRRQYEKDRTLR